MDCTVHEAAKSQTQLSEFHFHLHIVLKREERKAGQKKKYLRKSWLKFSIRNEKVSGKWNLIVLM